MGCKGSRVRIPPPRPIKSPVYPHKSYPVFLFRAPVLENSPHISPHKLMGCDDLAGHGVTQTHAPLASDVVLPCKISIASARSCAWPSTALFLPLGPCIRPDWYGSKRSPRCEGRSGKRSGWTSVGPSRNDPAVSRV